MDVPRVEAMVANSLPGVTALVPHIGYDRASQIAQHVHAHGLGRRQAALEIGSVGAADLETWVDMRRVPMSGGEASVGQRTDLEDVSPYLAFLIPSSLRFAEMGAARRSSPCADQ